jgi:hypothetical protein
MSRDNGSSQVIVSDVVGMTMTPHRVALGLLIYYYHAFRSATVCKRASSQYDQRIFDYNTHTLAQLVVDLWNNTEFLFPAEPTGKQLLFLLATRLTEPFRSAIISMWYKGLAYITTPISLLETTILIDDLTVPKNSDGAAVTDVDNYLFHIDASSPLGVIARTYMLLVGELSIPQVAALFDGFLAYREHLHQHGLPRVRPYEPLATAFLEPSADACPSPVADSPSAALPGAALPPLTPLARADLHGFLSAQLARLRARGPRGYLEDLSLALCGADTAPGGSAAGEDAGEEDARLLADLEGLLGAEADSPASDDPASADGDAMSDATDTASASRAPAPRWPPLAHLPTELHLRACAGSELRDVAETTRAILAYAALEDQVRHPPTPQLLLLLIHCSHDSVPSPARRVRRLAARAPLHRALAARARPPRRLAVGAHGGAGRLPRRRRPAHGARRPPARRRAPLRRGPR